MGDLFVILYIMSLSIFVFTVIAFIMAITFKAIKEIFNDEE